MIKSTRLLLSCSMLSLAIFAAGCGEEHHKQPEVRAVRTVVVAPRPVADDRRAIGEVKARYESDIAFRVSGKVVARTVDVGTAVKKGDVLARLDTQDFQNKLKSSESDIVGSEAALAEAQAAEARLRHLLANGHTTRANYDVALKNLRSAEAKNDAAKIAMVMARDQLGYTQLQADFDGIVSAVGVEAGQVINVGQMVVRLARPEERDAVFAIAESAFDKRNDRSPQEIVVALLSNPAVQAEGVVREVSPVADPATRTFQVKVTLKNPPEQMRFGASVSGRVKASSAPVVVLPVAALFDKAGVPAVWVVDRGKASIALKTVAVERYETDRVVVSAGLNPGDVVVTAGVNRLRENQTVRLAEGVHR